MLLPLPIVYRARVGLCGPACLYSAMLYWKGWRQCEKKGVFRETDLLESLEYDDECGVETFDIVRTAVAYEMNAKELKNCTVEKLLLMHHVGMTVILLIQAHRNDKDVDWPERWDDGHYVMFCGEDEEERLVFMDPSTATGYVWLTRDELTSRWHGPNDDGSHEVGTCVALYCDELPSIKRFPEMPDHLE